ncbi:MAG: class I lanthipeptide [Spirosomataceae bacterium]
MKKQFSKLSLKTDKIVSLSKNDAQAIIGGMPPQTKGCASYARTCSANGSAPCCTWNC